MGKNGFETFKWMNMSSIEFSEGKVIIFAPAESDFFCNNGTIATSGITPASLTNAPYFHTDISGDFVMKVQVQHEFQDTYDSASVMVYESDSVWAKACFEKTDFDSHAVVSVVTNQTSDDANGCNIEGNSAWLQITRVGNAFAFHYSTDGVTFFMMRFFYLPVSEAVKVGFLAQAPIGQGGYRIYQNYSLQQKTVENIRFSK